MAETMQPTRKIIPEEIMLARLARSEEMREFFIEMWRQNPALAKQGGARVAELLAPLEDRGQRTEDRGQTFVRTPRGLANRRGEAAAKPQSSVLSPRSSERGISLIELIMFIVIVSVALAGLLLVMNVTTKSSADPLVYKQALAVAESLLEEVELMPFTYCDPDDATADTATSATVGAGACTAQIENNGPEAAFGAQANAETRYGPSFFDNVNDYNGCEINTGVANPACDASGNSGILDITGAPIDAVKLAGYGARITVDNVNGCAGVAAPNALAITVAVTGPAGLSVAIDGCRTRYAPRATP